MKRVDSSNGKEPSGNVSYITPFTASREESLDKATRYADEWAKRLYEADEGQHLNAVPDSPVIDPSLSDRIGSFVSSRGLDYDPAKLIERALIVGSGVLATGIVAKVVDLI